MQKTFLYLLLLGILGFGVYYFVFSDKELFSRNEAAFNVKDTSDIGKIFLATTDGTSITLVRTDSGWILNDKYKARKGTLDNLLRTLKMQQPLYPVPENTHNSVIKSLSGSSTKVELYDRDGEPINIFYVGGTAYDFAGTYMLQQGAKRPYVVQIPNFHGFLSPSYGTDFDDWRDRTVMNLQPEQVRQYSISYATDSLSSFSIVNGPSLQVIAAPSVSGGKPLNERRARAYLKFFSEIYCEGYLNGTDRIDSIIASVPRFCTMDVTAKNGWRQHIDIYKMPLTKRSKNMSTEEGGEFDIDRFYGVINNFKDTVLLQAFTFDKFFRRGGEFFEPDASVNMMGIQKK